MLFSLLFAHFGLLAFWPFWPNRLESGVEVEGASVGLGQLYARLLGQVEEALIGDSAPCCLQAVIVFFCRIPRSRSSGWLGSGCGRWREYLKKRGSSLEEPLDNVAEAGGFEPPVR